MSTSPIKKLRRELREALKDRRKKRVSAILADLGVRLRAGGKARAGKSLLRRAVRLNPESVRLHLQLALCEAATGNGEGARREMERFTDEAMARPEKLSRYRDYARKELQGFPELAVLFFRREPVRVEERPPPLAPRDEQGEKTLSDLIAALETELGREADPRDGIGSLVRELRRQSEGVLAGDSKTRMDLALAFHEMGLITDACDELKRITAGDARFLDAQCLLGEFLQASGNDLQALDAYQRCLRESGAAEGVRAEARYRLAQIYLRLGDYARAGELVRELQREHPEYRDVRQLLVKIDGRAGTCEPKRAAHGRPKRG